MQYRKTARASFELFIQSHHVGRSRITHYCGVQEKNMNRYVDIKRIVWVSQCKCVVVRGHMHCVVLTLSPKMVEWSCHACPISACRLIFFLFTSMNTRTHILLLWLILKDWANLILKFIKSVIKSISLSMGTSPPTERIISRKYNTHIKSKI
jgi:hypothetical protein